MRGFTDRSDHCKTRVPTEAEADRVFNDMHKTTPESRVINCSTCGYDTCHDMMVAIFNRFNSKRSCIRYEMAETLRLERMSYSDQLTGVMNRNALEKALVDLKYHDKSLAVIVADIDGLKELNDTQGHEAGDRLIVSVATCLASAFGNSNVYRTGGDEFCIILQDHSEEECQRSIDRVKKTLGERGASASIGYAFCARYASNYAGLHAIADMNMYADKSAYYQRQGRKYR